MLLALTLTKACQSHGLEDNERIKQRFDYANLPFKACPFQGQHSMGALRVYTTQRVLAHRHTNEVKLLSPTKLKCNSFVWPYIRKKVGP